MNDTEIARRYYEAWTSRNIDKICALYADDIEFSSPYIAALGFAEDGVIVGKVMLRAYVERALERAPNLTFKPEGLFVGARGHTLLFSTAKGERMAESHEMDPAGLIIRADATYETS